MKDYSLLINSTYLYVLQHRDEKINFSKIAKEIGLTRQTVAKEYSLFVNLKNLNCFNIINFYNEEQNKYKRAMMILRDIDDTDYSQDQIAKMFNVSRSLISKCDNHQNIAAIYCIKYNNEIIYIGSTEDFNSRKAQHLNHIKQKHSTLSKLYQYCVNNCINENDVIIEIITTSCINKEHRLRLEEDLIKCLKPVGNDVFI